MRIGRWPVTEDARDEDRAYSSSGLSIESAPFINKMLTDDRRFIVACALCK